ncbi:MAG TPA: hypothetical protein VIZ43_28425 [Trebonia sp.]
MSTSFALAPEEPSGSFARHVHVPPYSRRRPGARDRIRSRRPASGGRAPKTLVAVL